MDFKPNEIAELEAALDLRCFCDGEKKGDKFCPFHEDSAAFVGAIKRVREPLLRTIESQEESILWLEESLDDTVDMRRLSPNEMLTWLKMNRPDVLLWIKEQD